MSTSNDARRNWQGGKWITPTRRLAIYIRDNFACVWCGRGIECETDPIRLSLDHVKPEVCGGSHLSTNLVTACTLCNSRRGKKSVQAFAEVAAKFFGGEAEKIVRRVKNATRRKVNIVAAREMIAARKAE